MIVTILIVAVLGIIYYNFPLIQIVGDSMFPTYKDGEVVVGTRLYRKSKLKVGDVVVFKSPTENKIVIKRIADVSKYFSGQKFYFLGDNSDCSYDSRYYGLVSQKRLVCKVINQRRNKNEQDSVCG